MDGAPCGTKMEITKSDVVAVLGRGSKVQILKSKVGYNGQRISPVKFLRMLIDRTV